VHSFRSFVFINFSGYPRKGKNQDSGARSQQSELRERLNVHRFGDLSPRSFFPAFDAFTFSRSFIFINFSGYPREGRNQKAGVRSQQSELRPRLNVSRCAHLCPLVCFPAFGACIFPVPLFS